MEIFYGSYDGALVRLSEEDSAHCVRVLRHREGDPVNVVDGEGTLFRCRLLEASPKGATATVEEKIDNWNARPYRLTLAVCPTKNNDRYEWFAEKATEFGVDSIVPVIGERSERKVFKSERARKIVLSAMKQSLKASLPEVAEPVSVRSFIESVRSSGAVKLIAWCFDDGPAPRVPVMEAIKATGCDEYIVLIGPEGDFSQDEARLAFDAGFRPISLGASRLRTETAGVAAAAAVYFKYM